MDEEYYEGFHDGALTVLRDLTKVRTVNKLLVRIEKWADKLEKTSPKSIRKFRVKE